MILHTALYFAYGITQCLRDRYLSTRGQYTRKWILRWNYTEGLYL